MNSANISVALPVFNGADYISDAIDSLLKQSGLLEVIVSDDCSTDRTLDLIEKKKDPRISILRNSTRAGQFGNFNRAIRKARGRYIQLFSHDDIADDGFLAAQRTAFERSDHIGLVYGSCDIIDSHGVKTARADDDGTPEIIDFETYLYISSRHGALPPSVSTVMISRRTLEVAGMFDESYQVDGDLEYYNRVAEKLSLARNRNVLLKIRTHPGSVTRGSLTPLRYAEEEVRILRFYERHLGQRDYKDMLRRRLKGRGVLHAKSILKTLAAGRLTQAAAHYRALSKIHNVPLCVCHALWQSSANLIRRGL